MSTPIVLNNGPLGPAVSEDFQYMTIVGILRSDNTIELQPSFGSTQVSEEPRLPLYQWLQPDPDVNVLTIEFVNEADQVVARQQIPMLPICSYPQGSVNRDLTVAGTVARPEDSVAMRILRSGNVIHQLNIPAESPQVAWNWNPPAPPQFAMGQQVVSWSANHPQGLPMRFMVFYSNTGGESWQPVAAMTDANQIEIDFDQVGGGNGKLRIMASDGINSASVDSLGFLVGPPRIIAIPQSLSFGTVQVGRARTAGFTLRNTGASPLEISEISDPSDEAFSIVGTRPSRIAPSGTGQLQIRFEPIDFGPYETQITVHSNDPRWGSLDLSMNGFGQELEPRNPDA